MNITLHTTTRHPEKMAATECKVQFCKGRIAHDESGDLDRHAVTLVVTVKGNEKTFTNSKSNPINALFMSHGQGTTPFTATVELV